MMLEKAWNKPFFLAFNTIALKSREQANILSP
jgi:hypothetical protein